VKPGGPDAKNSDRRAAAKKMTIYVIKVVDEGTEKYLSETGEQPQGEIEGALYFDNASDAENYRNRFPGVQIEKWDESELATEGLAVSGGSLLLMANTGLSAAEIAAAERAAAYARENNPYSADDDRAYDQSYYQLYDRVYPAYLKEEESESQA
jgi:hypothetical protein